MENLFALQSLQPQATAARRNRSGSVESARKKIPASILKHFDHLVAHGKKAVAVVRNGVCTECHITVAIGTLAGLAHDGDAQTCANCGRYLYLPPNEPIVPVKTRAHHAAGSLVHAHAA